jgi:hypothetical protein
MKIQLPIYPEDFFSFENGAFMDNQIINEWIQKGVECLEKETNRDHCCFGSGNTEVHICKYIDEYYISVAKKYSSASIPR